MRDILVSAGRGIDALVHPQVLAVLLVSSAFWTVVNAALGWFLLGPGLVVLFGIALKALRREETHWLHDNAAVIPDLPTSLVAGILLALPFRLWSALNELAVGVRQAQEMAGPPANAADIARLVQPGVPVTASLAVLVSFGFLVFTFPVLAERHCGVLEALRRSVLLADAPGRGGSHLLGMGRHLLFMSAMLLLFLGAASLPWARWLLMIVVVPPMIMVLAAWYQHVSAGVDGAPGADPRPEAELEDAV